MTKKSAKRPAKHGSRGRRAQAETVIARVAGALPAPVERVPAVRRAFEILEERELQVSEIGVSWREDLGQAVDRIQSDVAERIEDIETRTQRETRSLLRRLRTSAIAKSLRALPKRITHQVDGMLSGVGLIRTARHDELLARARRRAARKPQKRVATAAA